MCANHQLPQTIEVSGGRGRFAGMRTSWREEAPGLFVALADDGTTATIHGRRTEVYIDGEIWNVRLWGSRGHFAGTSLQGALIMATRQLHS